MLAWWAAFQLLESLHVGACRFCAELLYFTKCTSFPQSSWNIFQWIICLFHHSPVPIFMMDDELSSQVVQRTQNSASMSHEPHEEYQNDEDIPDQPVPPEQLSLTMLLGILASYQRCLPEAMADAGFDAGKLLSQVVLWLQMEPSLNGLELALLSALLGNSTHRTKYSPVSPPPRAVG